MEFKEQLREQVDIVRVVGDYVRLRRAGKRYSGLCPFHNEKTPSFSVSPEHQYFRCFGCDAKGDVFKFVEMIEGLTFFEALKKLADQHGMALPKQSFASDEETRLKAALHEMHEIAADHFRSNLAGPNGAATREYLSKRGVGEAAVQQFGLGLAEGSGRSLLRILEKRGFKPEQIEASGLAGQRDDGSFYDRFRNRLMFPIQNESGKVIAFGGRALDPEDKAKYLNSPETKIYRKSNVLYNLHRAKETAMKLDRIVLVEGYMDAIGAWQAGVREVVASCGTALTVEQIRAMKRHSLNLHLNFDPDAAGAKASERSVKLLLDESMKVRIVELEAGSIPMNTASSTALKLTCSGLRVRKLIFTGSPTARARSSTCGSRKAASMHFNLWCLRFRILATNWRALRMRTIWRATWASIRALCWNIFESLRRIASTDRRSRRPIPRAPPIAFCSLSW